MATPALAVERLDLAYRTDEGMLRALRDTFDPKRAGSR